MPRPLSLQTITGFFVPLILWAQLMMITHSAVHAGLARQVHPTIALAAYSIAFTVHATLSATMVSMSQISLSFATSRGNVHRLLGFGALLVAVNSTVSLLIGLTVVGRWLYGGLFGASPTVVAQAQTVSVLLAFSFPLQMVRNVLAALLMQARRTLLISVGTGVRIAALFGWMWLLAGSIGGAPLGAAALGLCIAVESVLLGVLAWPFYCLLPATGERVAGLREIWRFAWPLMVNTLSDNGIAIVINFFLGRLAQPDLALATFGVVRGLALLLLSPLRNLAQTAQTLCRHREDLRAMLRFTLLGAGVGTVVIAVLFLTPLRGWVLGTVMGLQGPLAAYAATGTLVLVAMPLAWSYAAAFRGLLAGARHTRAMATSGLVRLAIAGAVSSLCLLLPTLNGALIGTVAMTASFAAEAVLLGAALRPRVRAGLAFAPAAPSTGRGS